MESLGNQNVTTAKQPERYVNYALQVWAKFPEVGPAYIYQSATDVRGPYSRQQSF